MNMNVVKLVIEMERVSGGQYFCQGRRLAFDLPWSIYIVNGDMYVPYYRVYINDCLMGILSTESQAYEYLKNMSPERAHIAEM